MTSARVTFLSATDDEALNCIPSFSQSSKGIIPALEPAHAIAKVLDLAPQKPKDHLMVVISPARGDKDSIPWRGIWEAARDDRTYRERFAALQKENRAALVTFTMAGDPDYATAVALLRGAAQGGADIIELGMPFTDPMADGRPSRRRDCALSKPGKHEKDAGRGARIPRGDDATPLVLMGYYNPIYVYGVDTFLADAKAAGVDGLDRVDFAPGGRR